jgi:hypothetical protein
MKSRRYRKSKKFFSRRNRKGGEYNYSDTSNQYQENNTSLNNCDLTNLSNIHGTEALHANYQKCCPKGTFGSKNTSPYCKQLDLNFQAALKAEQGNYSNDGSEITPNVELPQAEYNTTVAQSKPWYKFWGGKKSRRHRKKTYS